MAYLNRKAIRIYIERKQNLTRTLAESKTKFKKDCFLPQNVTKMINSKIPNYFIYKWLGMFFVVPPGFEPGTHGFSVHCSTNWAKVPCFRGCKYRTNFNLYKTIIKKNLFVHSQHLNINYAFSSWCRKY